MRLDNLLHLIGGELKNSPAIKSFQGFSADLEHLKKGDLYFARDRTTIDQAIKGGAYGIVYEGWSQISDEEIPWIKVANLHEALLRLSRFYLIKNRALIYALDPLTFDLAHTLIDHPKASFIKEDLFEILGMLEDVEFLFLHPDLAQKLSLDIAPLPKAQIEPVQEYLFEYSFVYDGRFFERARISPLFAKELELVLGIIKECSFYFDPQRLHHFSHFHPIFVDTHFRPKEFGKSERALIIEPDPALLERERRFLESKAPWAKKLYIAKKRLEGFEPFEEIREILYNLPFHYALIGAENFQIDLLKPLEQEFTLF
ncbi:MAG: hypothetical protein C6H99_05115 [Epsilonproteobacteria bacterium]|nr:hypothetical protein [Campylobacterota bacterium]NPA65139.1 hypothetical protein [Campylobacterota bacterium]